jgi:TRAP-type uncharacterized transport system substrate-binding protein
MPPGLPNRPPLAMKLWLARRSGKGGSGDGMHAAAEGRSSGRTMSMHSLENRVRSRVRIFLRHTTLVTLLGTAVVGALIWAGVHYSLQDTVMRIAVGPPESANAKFVDVLSKIVTDSHDRMKVEIVPTDGAAASAQALAKKQADLAVVPTTVGKSPDWPVVAILRQNVMAFVVPAPPPPPPPPAPAAAKDTKPAPAPAKGGKSGKAGKAGASSSASAAQSASSSDSTSAKGKKAAAKSAKNSDDDTADDSDDSDKSSDDSKTKKMKVTDLAGKRVGIVNGNEASTDLLDVVLKHYGVPLDKVQISQIDPADVAAAVQKGAVDVLFVAGAATGKAISDTVAAATQNGVAPTFIEIDHADGISKRNTAFDSDSIDAGTFGGNPPTPGDDLKSVTFAEYLVARKTFNHNTIAELSKLIYTSRLAIANQLAGEIKIEAPSTDKDADVLAHPGTLDYLNDDQKTFFDRYGDDIFYGMLIFPVFGSAIAGVASYLRSDSRTRRLRLLQRVLDMVRKAHNAQTLEAIEHLQVEADNLVIAIIHLSEHEEFDESVRMSFSFALDQLRFAVAARRTAILDHADGKATTEAKAIADARTEEADPSAKPGSKAAAA